MWLVDHTLVQYLFGLTSWCKYIELHLFMYRCYIDVNAQGIKLQALKAKSTFML